MRLPLFSGTICVRVARKKLSLRCAWQAVSVQRVEENGDAMSGEVLRATIGGLNKIAHAHIGRDCLL